MQLTRRKAAWSRAWRSKPGSRRIIWTSVQRQTVVDPHWLDGHFHDAQRYAFQYGGVRSGRMTATQVMYQQKQASAQFLKVAASMHKMLEPFMRAIAKKTLVWHDEFDVLWDPHPVLRFKFQERTGHANLPPATALPRVSDGRGRRGEGDRAHERRYIALERERREAGSGRAHRLNQLRGRVLVRLHRAARHGGF